MEQNVKKITPFQAEPDPGTKTEPGSVDVKVMKLENKTSSEPQAYEFMKLNKRKGQTYQDLKSQAGSFAVTDNEYANRDQKSSRFQLNPMLRGALKIEGEEQRAIEMLVKTQVAKLAGLAQQEASDRGFNEGFVKGKASAEAQYKEEFQSRIVSFDQFLKACETAKLEIFLQNEKFIIDTIYQVAQMVLLRELKEDRSYIIRLTRELIEKMGTKENVSILISKEDLSHATQIQETLEKAIGALQNLQIEASEKVQLGGCIVETQWNTIDARIEVQLNHIRESLGGHTAQAQAEIKPVIAAPTTTHPGASAESNDPKSET